MKPCQDSATILSTEINTTFVKKMHVEALFMDIQGAFDNVTPAGMP